MIETAQSPRWFKARDSQAAEVEDYHDAVDALDIEAVRKGPQLAPSRVRSLVTPGLSVTACDVGFEKMVRTVVPDHAFVVALVVEAPEGARWRGGELALNPGLVATYHPGAEHTGLNVPGFAFTFTVVDLEPMEARAEQLQVALKEPVHGLIALPPMTASTKSAGGLLRRIRELTDHGSVPPRMADDLLTSVALMGASEDTNARSRPLGRVNSWEVVVRCIDYAEATGRVPAISELCLAGQVGESRLRQAFRDVYEISPTRFFRDWALTQAHHRLRLAEPGERSVTDVATALGLNHLGRFSVQYRELYGECPSQTLSHSVN